MTWREEAACAPDEVPVGWFFPLALGTQHSRSPARQREVAAQALSVCRRCSHRLACLNDALAFPHDGVAGGTVPVERRDPRRARLLARVGRPEWFEVAS